MIKLKEQQKEVLDVIIYYLLSNGYFPSIREISMETGRSVKFVHKYLKELENDGIVEQKRPRLYVYKGVI